MKIILNISIKPDAIPELLERFQDNGGVEAAKKELAELLLGDDEAPDEVDSLSITIEAPELEGKEPAAQKPLLRLGRNHTGETWLHVDTGIGLKASLNLGRRAPDDFFERVLVAAFEQQEGSAA